MVPEVGEPGGIAKALTFLASHEASYIFGVELVMFRYTEKGPEGLVNGKKVCLVLAHGGIYSEGPMQALNFQDTYLKVALGLIGLTDIEVITIEGVAFGADAAGKAVNAALEGVSALAA